MNYVKTTMMEEQLTVATNSTNPEALSLEQKIERAKLFEKENPGANVFFSNQNVFEVKHYAEKNNLILYKPDDITGVNHYWFVAPNQGDKEGDIVVQSVNI